MSGQSEKVENEKYDWFDLPEHRRYVGSELSSMKYYPIETVVSDVLEHYIEDEAQVVKDICNRNNIRANSSVREYLLQEIQSLNDITEEEAYINREKKKTIKIPKNIEFFRNAFPDYIIMKEGDTTIRTEIGQLKYFSYNHDLEKFVRNEIGNISNVDINAKSWINISLLEFKIHSHRIPFSVEINTPEIKESIRIFQQEYMNLEKPDGIITVDTIFDMNKALGEKWERKLCFFYYEKTDTNKQSPQYINDVDIQININNGLDIYGKEGDKKEVYLGFRTGEKYHGVAHNAKVLFEAHAGNIIQKVCAPIIKSEGGGYDAINEWDNVALSIGLFNFNQDDLWDSMRVFREENEENYNNLLKQYGLDINKKASDKRFIIDGIEYIVPTASKNTWDFAELRKLKFAYCFIKVATYDSFKESQNKKIESWATSVIVYSLKNNKKIKDYITSEYGIAFVIDLSVKKGKSVYYITAAVQEAIDTVIKDGCPNNPDLWSNKEESKIIDAFTEIWRTRINDKKVTDTREKNIKNAGLSKERASFK